MLTIIINEHVELSVLCQLIAEFVIFQKNLITIAHVAYGLWKNMNFAINKAD